MRWALPMMSPVILGLRWRWRWRTSAAALRHTVSADQRLYLIETRSALLDEFARRGPAGFTRWVHTDTHSVNDPARFLTTPSGN